MGSQTRVIHNDRGHEAVGSQKLLSTVSNLACLLLPLAGRRTLLGGESRVSARACLVELGWYGPPGFPRQEVSEQWPALIMRALRRLEKPCYLLLVLLARQL